MHSSDLSDLASTLCRYDLRKYDLFVLSWARVRRVSWGSISSKLIMCSGGVRSILFLPLVVRCFVMQILYVCVLCASCVHPVAVLNTHSA